MKRNVLKSGIAMLAGIFLFVGMANAKNGTYKVDTQKSKVEWLGKKVTGEHSGTIMISDGSIILNGDDLKSGSFVVDMNSIKCTDIKDEGYRAKLEGHLKSDDFFGIEKFPKSKFEIVESKYLGEGNYKVKGNITIKEITKPIEFTVNLHKHGEDIHVSGKVVIDRSKFNIRYGSGSFFDNLGDKTIYDDFELTLDLYLR